MHRTLPAIAFGLVAITAPTSSVGQTQGPSLSKDAIVKCADAGIAECQYRLAQMTEDGDQVVKDVNTARQLYELAYRNGYAPAGDAILRMAKAQPTPSNVTAAPTSAATKSAPLAAPNAAHPLVATPAIGQVTFLASGDPAGLNPFYLGQSEQEVMRVMPQAQCERDEFKTCMGTFGAGDASTDFLVVLDRGRVAAVTGLIAKDCDTNRAALSRRFPVASPMRTKLMGAKILKDIAKDLPPDATITAWAPTRNWSAFAMCGDDGSGMMVIANGQVTN